MQRNQLVPEARLELARPKSGDFESPASTNSATRALTAGYSLSLALSILPRAGHAQEKRLCERLAFNSLRASRKD